jgi:cytochrome c-type biogenesis protein CcmH
MNTHCLEMAIARLALLLVLSQILPSPALAVLPDEILPNPRLEARARMLSEGLRCVVCQNQSIDDSNAPLARDLRILLRERLTAGDTDAQAVDFIVSRYGNFVLLKPPMQWNTLALWFGPAVLLLMAAFAFGRYIRNAPAPDTQDISTAFSDAERKRLAVLLDEGNKP